MPRKGENIYKRKDGRWEGRYIRDRSNTGKAIYGYVYAHSYREVKSKLIMSINSQNANQSCSFDKKNTKDSEEFGVLATSWMNSIKPHVKESTYIKYQNSLKNYILPQLENKKLEDLSYSCIEQFTIHLLTAGGKKQTGLSSKTVADIMSILRNIFHYADRQGYKIAFICNNVKIQQDTHELPVFTASEQSILQQYLCSNLTNRNLGLLLCLFTGIRIGEICALRWEDIGIS